MTKKDLKALFLESLMKDYKWNLFDDIWSWPGSIRNKSQGFHASIWERG